MKKRLVIFGTGDIAEVAGFYFDRDGIYEVVGFTVDPEFVRENQFYGRPVIATDELIKAFPPTNAELFVAVGYSKVNQIRMEKYFYAKSLGYQLASYISPLATIYDNRCFGDNCFILEDNTVQPFVRVGNNVTLWSGNHIGHHSVIGDHCYLASHIVVSGRVVIGKQVFIGVNATLRDNISVGDRCVIGAGALMLSDAEADGIYKGTETVRKDYPSSRLARI